MKRKIRIAVVGIGHLGKHHARILASDRERVDLAAQADVQIERAEANAREYGGVPLSDYRDIPEIDAVCIVAPTENHHEITRHFLERKVHVLVEKPVASTPDEARDMIGLAAAENLILQVGHLERYNPAVLAVEDKIVEPKFIECHRLSPFPKRSTDVDVILDLMIHDLDLILNWVKSPLADLNSAGASVLTDKIDIANVRLQFENGCVANVTASRVSETPMRRMRIFQHDSYMRIDFQAQKVRILKRVVSEGKPAVVPEETRIVANEPLLLELHDFVSSVCTGTRPKAGGEEGLAALELAFKVKAALRQ